MPAAEGALKFFLGWPALGWIGGFVWSLTISALQQTVIVQTAAGTMVHAGDRSPDLSATERPVRS